MPRSLVIFVRFHDGVYNGLPEWPPSPARLFQALVAGSAGAGTIVEDAAALGWLEELPHAPTVCAPVPREGRGFNNYVPNNDRDSTAFKKALKAIKARFFDATVALSYAWPLDDFQESECQARDIARIADTLYQLGRGVDMAWAWGEVLDDAEEQRRLAEYPGVVYRPCTSGSGEPLACPQSGSLDSLLVRHRAQRRRFSSGSNSVKLVFAQPPRPRFKQVAYNSPVANFVYMLDGSAWPLDRCVALVELARDKAAERLANAVPASKSEIDRVLIGRGATQQDKAARVQVLPLPSIGHAHADRLIRRVLVRVPPNCPIARDSVEWAFSGLPLRIDSETGEILLALVSSESDGMLRHYGGDSAPVARRWRTVTPAALPRARSSRNSAAEAVRQALRHADLPEGADVKRIQREPFEAHGQRAESFNHEPRFAGNRLWHVEVEFRIPIAGPVAIGDGRFLGLGLMRPMTGAESATGVHCLRIEAGLHSTATVPECVRALRRATIARVQESLGRGVAMPTFFTGHEADGKPSTDPDHSHLGFAIDLARARVLVLAPHRLQGRAAGSGERSSLAALDSALQGMSELRAGASGLLRLAAATVDGDSDPLFRASRVWRSVTDYLPTRHAKRTTATEALVADVAAEIGRRGLPLPQQIEVLELRTGPRGGVAGRLQLHFKIAVAGPLLLGRTRHMGGGLFAAEG